MATTLIPLRSTSPRNCPVNSRTCGSSSSGRSLQRGMCLPLSPRTYLVVPLGLVPVPASPGVDLTTQRDALPQDVSSSRGGASEHFGPGGALTLRLLVVAQPIPRCGTVTSEPQAFDVH